MTTMRGIAKLRPEPGLWMTQAPVPEPGPEEVLIRVRNSAICGTDLHIWNWDDWASRTIKPPLIIGHEFSGEIEALGPGVASKRLKVGQKVSAEGHIVDLESAAARLGQFHLDPNTLGLGVNRQGAFADYLVMPAFNVVPLPEEVSLETGAILDPFGNAVHTCQQFELMGQDVLITGAGPIGAMAAAVAKRAGARNIIVTDLNPFRLGLAEKLGATRTVDVTKEDLRDVMAAEGIEDGFDVALEMSGAPAAIDQAIESLRMGGGLALLSSGLDLTPLITHRKKGDDFKEGFEAALAGEAGKVVLEW